MFNRLVAMASAALITAAILSACAAPAPKPATPAPAPVAAPPPLKSGLDLAGFDRSVRPQDDLYRFVGGTWLAKTPIPADRSNYGSFTILDDQAREEVKQLIVAASTQADRPRCCNRATGKTRASARRTASGKSRGCPAKWR